MTRLRFTHAWLTAPLVLSSLAVSTMTPAQAYPYQASPYRVSDPWAYGDMVSDGSDPQPPAMPAPAPLPGPYPYATQPYSPVQLAQRCNTGRLLGGLLGGGIGYGMSRKDGRAWAVPLGALLGSQVGCSAAVGRGPLPW
jgi:hypothetical protein